MPTLSITQSSFTGGEFAPSLYKRTQLAKYFTATRLLRNMLIHPHGGASNRPGTRFVAEIKDSTKIARLVPFQFSVVQSYIIEFGDQYVRFIKDGGQIIYSPRTSLSIVNSTYKWTLSGSGTNEYYLELAAGGDPSVNEPTHVLEDTGSLDSGTIGSLSAGEYDHGDNDTLGFSTIYVRLTDNTDPDSKVDDFLLARYHTATSIVNPTYKWTASGSGTAEFYLELVGGGDPSIALPSDIFTNGLSTTRGTLGSLTAGLYDYGDNDSLGFSTLYIRLSDDSDPDTKQYGHVEVSSIVEVATPYLEADIALLKFTQSADVLFITHPSYAPRKLSRTAHDIWTLTTIVFGSDISAPTGLVNAGSGVSYVVTAVDLEGDESLPSTSVDGAPGSATTWGAVDGAEFYNVFKDTNGSGTFGWIGQANSTSFTEPAATLNPDYDITPPNETNPFDTPNSFPGVSTFFEQRLIFGRTNLKPQSFFGSVVGNFENLNKSSPLKDDDAYSFTLNAKQVNEIRWFVPLRELLIGTSGSEWRVRPGGNSDAITPTSVDVKQQSIWGVDDLQPIVIGNTAIFLEGSKQKVRDLLYSFEVDGYAGNDLSILANHLFTDFEILEWSYQQNPDSVIWCVRNDGKMLGLTYYKEHEVWGWHRHDTDGEYESIATIRTSGGVDDTYIIAKREINGVEKRYIELMADRLPANSDQVLDVQDAFFVDSGLTLDAPLAVEGITQADPAVITITDHGLTNDDIIDIVQIKGMTQLNNDRFKVAGVTANTFELNTEAGATIDSSAFNAYLSGGKVRKAVTVLSGLSHLEGKTVAILANGSVVKNKVVASGSITLDNPASRIHIGLGYTSDLETLDFEYPTENGNTVQDRQRQIHTAVVSMENTRAMLIGPNDTHLDEIKFRTSEDYGNPIEMFTGDKEIPINSSNDRESRIFIRNEDPVPISILSLIVRMNHGEK